MQQTSQPLGSPCPFCGQAQLLICCVRAAPRPHRACQRLSCRRLAWQCMAPGTSPSADGTMLQSAPDYVPFSAMVQQGSEHSGEVTAA